MKKIILFLLLLLGLLPNLKKGKISLNINTVYAQDYGYESEDYWTYLFADEFNEDLSFGNAEDIIYGGELPEVNVYSEGSSITTTITLPTVYVTSGGSTSISDLDFGSLGITFNMADYYGANGNMLPEVTVTATVNSNDGLYAFYSLLDTYTNSQYNKWQDSYNLDPNTIPPPPPAPPVPVNPNKTDCDEAKKANTRMSNTNLINQDNTIRSNTIATNVEYGAEQNLSTFPPSSPPGYNTVQVRTNSLSNNFSPNFTWNAIDGYTVGISHGHPADGAPSPADLVYAYENLSNPDLLAGGQTAIDYYKANFSITVTTQNETFIVTVKDWTALGTFYNTHYANVSVSNQAWINEASNYSTNNPTATYGDITAYAGLKLYGNAISISKGNTNSSNFVPLKIDANNKITNIPCPK